MPDIPQEWVEKAAEAAWSVDQDLHRQAWADVVTHHPETADRARRKARAVLAAVWDDIEDERDAAWARGVQVGQKEGLRAGKRALLRGAARALVIAPRRRRRL